jgi:hypothetical protein
MRALAIMATSVLMFAPPKLPGQQGSDRSRRQSLSLFVGATASPARHETAVTIGPRYRYLLTRQLALGPILEMTCYRSETATVFLGGAFFRPYRRMEITVAPGIEWVTATADVVEPMVERGLFTIRAGVGYDIKMRRGHVLSPEAAINLGSGAATGVYGLTFGISF